MGAIRIAIAGLGNCASSLIQGIDYYRTMSRDDPDSFPDTDIFVPPDEQEEFEAHDEDGEERWQPFVPPDELDVR